MVAFTSLGSLSHLHRSLFNNGLEMGYASAPGASPPPRPTQHHPHQQQLKHLGVTLQYGKHCSLPPIQFHHPSRAGVKNPSFPPCLRIDRPPARAGGQGTDLGQLYHSPALLPQETSLISPGFISSVLMQEYNKFFM